MACCRGPETGGDRRCADPAPVVNASAQPSFPVVIIGAGPTGVTAATLLAQHGVQCLLLDRWAMVYPQPRAVHLDDEIYRILAQLGIAEQFATISRPGAGMRLLDHRGQILSQIARAPIGTHGYPQANMFDQPELEQLLRANLTNYPQVSLRGGVEVTTIAHISASQVQVTFTNRDSGDQHKVTATYVLGCDGANSMVRAAIGASMTARQFAQRWLVVDLNTDADLGHWDGVHHLCDPDRATTFMRVGERRYRWEFKLRHDETVADYDTVEKLRPLIAVWTGASAISELTLVRVTEYTFRAHVASHWRDRNVFILGDAAHLTPPFVDKAWGWNQRRGQSHLETGRSTRRPAAYIRAGYLRTRTKTPRLENDHHRTVRRSGYDRPRHSGHGYTEPASSTPAVHPRATIADTALRHPSPHTVCIGDQDRTPPPTSWHTDP